MNINSDFAARAAVHSAKLAWSPSPIAGVDRRMLDRIGSEVARATTIVRFAPKSKFSPHTHTGGEEFLVLDGVFEDEHGAFPAGSYIRNPPQTSHTPGSGPGCTIFVKLWQFDLADRKQIQTDIANLDHLPDPERAGIQSATLHQDEREHVRSEYWQANARVTFMPENGIEILVLGGEFREGGESFDAGSWLRLPIGAGLDAMTGPQGARLWVKEGHLPFALANLPG